MSLTIRTDVTAIKFFKNLILAGTGSYVSIFDKHTSKILRRLKCLASQKIHGFVISKCEQKVLAFGGKQFVLLHIKVSEEDLSSRCMDPVLCNDWIHAVTWIDIDAIALLTAHNVVQKWEVSSQTLLSQHASTDNSILYSGLFVPVQDELIVLSGTVYSEIIIRSCSDDRALHRLKGHRGVIFSISCDPEKAIIVTTSDDRSVRIWTMKNLANHSPKSLYFWYTIQIECLHEVYGHMARVMRSSITKKYIISCGEDAGICFWSFDGKLIRKVYHQTSTIWSVDSDNEHIVTGGGDSGIILHPIAVASDYYQKKILNTDSGVKKIQFTARNNIVIVNDNDELIYHDVKGNTKTAYNLHQKSTYKVLSLSSCKQIIAIADMEGYLNIFIEACKGIPSLKIILSTKINIDKLMSLHWAGNRHLVVCSFEGRISVLVAMETEIEEYCGFILPSCRERYVTAAAMNPANNAFIIGDRCGNIHCFVKGQLNPVKSFKKVHGSYGATSVKLKNNVIITTGRIGSISHHVLEENIAESRFLMEKKLEFQWVEKFLDKDENLICGFQEKKFVVHAIKTNTKILEVQCGGGHRPWDAVRYFESFDGNIEEFIRLTYVQNSKVYLVTCQLSQIIPNTIVNGSHPKIIHCLQTCKILSTTYYISGGEDTTLRISSMNKEFDFHDEMVLKQLSNIRCLKILPTACKQILVVSAGGRAQVCINIFKFELNDENITISSERLVDFMLKGNDEERRRLKSTCNQEYDFNPETRMMDIDAMRIDSDKYLLFVGCSDSLLRVYKFEFNEKDVRFNLIKEIEYHKTCILKTVYIKFQNIDLLLTATTRGEIVFWNLIYDVDEFKIDHIDNDLNVDNAGTNSIHYKSLEDKLLLAIGGDNNAISLFLIALETKDTSKTITDHKTPETLHQKSERLSIKIIDQVTKDCLHCSQITGLVFLDDLMISSSIDQRMSVCRWWVHEDKITCTFLRQVFSDVADIAGLSLLEHSSDFAKVCVYGKGLEVLQVDLTDPE